MHDYVSSFRRGSRVTEASTVTINDNTYSVADLSEEAKQCLSALQITEQQLRFFSDTIGIMSVSRDSLVTQMQSFIKDVEPILASAVEKEE